MRSGGLAPLARPVDTATARGAATTARAARPRWAAAAGVPVTESEDASAAAAATATSRCRAAPAIRRRGAEPGRRLVAMRSYRVISHSSWPNARPIGRPHQPGAGPPPEVPRALHPVAADPDARLDMSSRGRSPDSRINASPCLPRTGVPVASLGFAPRSQWRDRAGLPPASLFSPRLNVAGGHLGRYANRAAASFCTAAAPAATDLRTSRSWRARARGRGRRRSAAPGRHVGKGR